MKYIDSEKLIAEIERRRLSNRYIDTEGYENELLEIITSLQQEQPEVDLEKEIKDWCNNAITGYEPIYTGSSLKYSMLPACAFYFYELGQRTKYQQDRLEFAKLKAKEWQDGYDEGYAKGLNARKEE